MSDLNRVLNSIIDQRRVDNKLTGTLPVVPPPPALSPYQLNPRNPAQGNRVSFLSVYGDQRLLSEQYPQYNYAGEIRCVPNGDPVCVKNWVVSEQSQNNNTAPIWTEIGKKSPSVPAATDVTPTPDTTMNLY